jgi:hypothetical protein
MVVGLDGFTSLDSNPTHFGGTNYGTRRSWGIGSCPSGILLGDRFFDQKCNVGFATSSIKMAGITLDKR